MNASRSIVGLALLALSPLTASAADQLIVNPTPHLLLGGIEHANQGFEAKTGIQVSMPKNPKGCGATVLGLKSGKLDAGVMCGPAPLRAEDQQLAFGVQMAKRGLWSEALFRFRQAERTQPGNPRVLNNLAVAYEAVGLFDEALETYKAALKADPANRELRRNYSRFIEFYQAFRPDEESEQEIPAALERPAPEAPESSTEDKTGL